jgi:hypothetical protein
VRKQHSLSFLSNRGPRQIERMFAICSNQIATLADVLTGYKSDVAIKDTIYKRAFARAIINGRLDGVPATIVAKVAEVRCRRCYSQRQP